MNSDRMSNQKRRGIVRRSFLPVLVWLLAVGAVCFLFVYRDSRFTAVGIAEARTCVFSAPDSGWLLSLPVHLYQQVRQGQPLATLRLVPEGQARHALSQYEAEKAAALSELEYLKVRADLVSRERLFDESREQTEGLYREHQLALDVEKVRLLILEIQSALEPAKIQLKDLEVEKQVLEDLLAKKAIEPYELQKVQVQAEALAVQIFQDEQRLQQARQDLEAARGRLEAFRAALPKRLEPPMSLQSLQKAITEQEKRLAELFAPSFDVMLEAPFDGVVTSISCTAGQTVAKGMPILTLIAPSVEYVTAWVEPDRSGSLALHQPVEIVKTSAPRRVLRSEIAEIGPGPELMPERLWKNPSIPEWGRPVRIPVHPQLQLMPNERVGVRGI